MAEGYSNVSPACEQAVHQWASETSPRKKAQASSEARSRVSSFVPLAHVLFTIERFSYDLEKWFR